MRNIPVRQKPIGNLPTHQATELEIQMSEQQDQVIQEQGAEPQQPAVKFPVLGSASAKLTFNYRQPSKSVRVRQLWPLLRAQTSTVDDS